MVADDDDQSSIPSVVDGLTPLQRTILLFAFKNPGLKKVKEFIALLSAQSGYKKRMLLTTMTGMTQNYPGSNNGNLLRLYGAGGLIELSSITRHLFHESDQPLRKYLYDDEKSIEPPWLMPVIPMVLVNGSQGTGTNYNLSEVIASIRRLLKGQDLGNLLKNTETSYTTFGEEYEAHQHSETTIRDQMEQEVGYHKNLELDTRRSKMHLLDKQGLKRKYGSLEAILKEFYDLRLKYYEKRKSAMLDAVTKAMEQLEDEDDDDFCTETIIRYDKEAEVLFAELKDNHRLRYRGKFSWATIVCENNPRHVEFFEKRKELNILYGTSAQKLWSHDLDALEEQLGEQYKENEAKYVSLEQYVNNEAEGREKWISLHVSDSESEEDDVSPPEQYGKNEAVGREKWMPPVVSDSESEEDDSPEQDEKNEGKGRKRRRTT